MPQFARPDGDTVVGNYTTDSGGTINLFATIDEVTASDADFVRSPTNPVNEVYTARLSDVTDPVASTGHIMRMRTSTDIASGGETLDFTLELRQGYVNEGTQGTLIATHTRNGVSGNTWTDTSYTLSGAEADAITNYNDLFYRFKVNKP